MFKKGETVVYGSQGVCEINDICIMNFGKTEGEYYMLKPVYDENSTIYVPVDNDLVTSRMQRLITKEELESLIADVRSEKTDWICNDLERKAFCEAVISSGDRKALMKLIGMLYVRKNSLKTQKKHFHLADEKLLKEAEKIISDEIAYVTGIDRNKVSDYVSERIMHGQRAFIGE
ncbi:MAG: CarD family transcriptional regulator [Clostridia bacterium]|nr:CarD family transcriptional regulator [Clostridia bacterium]